MELLIKYNADPLLKNFNGFTVLDGMNKKDDPEIMALLTKYDKKQDKTVSIKERVGSKLFEEIEIDMMDKNRNVYKCLRTGQMLKCTLKPKCSNFVVNISVPHDRVIGKVI